MAITSPTSIPVRCAALSGTTTLTTIVRREVDLYAGSTHQATLHTVHDDQNQTYAVVVVPDKADDRPAWVMVMARVVDDTIIIEEDTSLDRPLVDALMVNAGVPREQIILAYKGEAVPTNG